MGFHFLGPLGVWVWGLGLQCRRPWPDLGVPVVEVPLLGVLIIYRGLDKDYRGIILRLYRDNGKENGNYYNTGIKKILRCTRSPSLKISVRTLFTPADDASSQFFCSCIIQVIGWNGQQRASAILQP